MNKEWNIQLFKLNYDEREIQAVSDVLESGWITSGSKTSEFEELFASYLGNNCYACAVSSCTAALHLSLIASNVGPGDEVIIPALTFVAAANVVLNLGAIPIMADCDSFDNWNVSKKNVKNLITSKTKAIMVVHFAGEPCSDIHEISNLCKERSIKLIEDVAHAPGAELNKVKCGLFGDFACFSFYTNKNLSVGEGGMVVSKCIEDHQLLSRLRSHGMTVATLDRYKGKAMSYDVINPGLNYRIDEMRSALGIVQLKKLNQSNSKRGELVAEYKRQLEKMPIEVPFSNKKIISTKPSYHIFPILLDRAVDRDDFMQFLKQKGVQTSIHYPALDGFTGLKNKVKGHNEFAAKISQREVTLPLHTNLTVEEVTYVCGCIEEYVNAQ